jgi:hypothetical protein
MKPLLILLLAALCALNSYSQDIYKDVDLFFKAPHQKFTSNELISKILSSNASDAYYAINKYTLDSSATVRLEAYRLLGVLGTRTTDKEARLRCAKQLVLGIKDSDAGIIGNVIDLLTGFTINDFDNESTNNLLIFAVNDKVPHYVSLVKLIGYLGIQESKDEFKKRIEEKKYPNNNVRWALHLALARMGDPLEIEYCMSRVKEAKINSILVYEIFPDIVYIRQKLAFDYFLTVIESENKDCSSPNPDSDAKIICAYQVSQLIAPHIKNFPISTDLFGEISWGKNPQAALARIREWIKINRETYELNRDRY